MQITIIGANSYIARNLIHKINKTEHQLYLYDRENFHKDLYVNYTKIDILRLEEVEKINFDVDIFYIFAGKTGTSNGFDDYEAFIDVNEKALLKILDVYRRKKSAAKIIFPSTRLVYKGSNMPLKEDDEKEFKTLYAINKFSCENYLKMYSTMYGVSYCVFRICLPYGTAVSQVSSYGTVEFFLDKAKKGEEITIYGDGQQKRTVTHIEDLCDVLWKGAINNKCKNDVYNIGGADILSIYDIANKIADLYNVKVRQIKWPEDVLKLETGDTIFDSSKLDSILNQKYTHKMLDWIETNI